MFACLLVLSCLLFLVFFTYRADRCTSPMAFPTLVPCSLLTLTLLFPFHFLTPCSSEQVEGEMKGFREGYAGLSKQNLHCGLCQSKLTTFFERWRVFDWVRPVGRWQAKSSPHSSPCRSSLPFSRGGVSLTWTEFCGVDLRADRFGGEVSSRLGMVYIVL